MNRRKESKLATTTQSLTKRIAVSLASLRSLPRRLRHEDSQTSIEIEDCSYENVQEIQHQSLDEFSIEDSMSGSETIKESSNEEEKSSPIKLNQSLKSTNKCRLHPQGNMGSNESLNSSTNGNPLEMMEIPKDVTKEAHNHNGVNSTLNNTHRDKIGTLSSKTADLESDEDNAVDEICNWVSTI